MEVNHNMPFQIYNSASLTYKCGLQTGCAHSNTATTTLQDSLSLDAYSLQNTYKANQKITNIISITNNSDEPIKNISVESNLGSYSSETSTFTPMNYVGISQLYQNGIFEKIINAQIKPTNITFNIDEINDHSNILIIYETEINNKAPLSKDSSITQVYTVTSTNILRPITKSISIEAENYANINIVKTMSPNPVIKGQFITYTFNIYNYGNEEATNIVLQDSFNPLPSIIDVSVNSQKISSEQYSYINGAFLLPRYGSDFLINTPPAQFIRNFENGEFEINPGVTVITIKGRINQI